SSGLVTGWILVQTAVLHSRPDASLLDQGAVNFTIKGSMPNTHFLSASITIMIAYKIQHRWK
ncbi:MAG: hypothetical protein KC449_24750, partial [Anaerolineales bacterium]|nr:hypothetical protein [Anaerolineales bacterium]